MFYFCIFIEYVYNYCDVCKIYLCLWVMDSYINILCKFSWFLVSSIENIFKKSLEDDFGFNKKLIVGVDFFFLGV